MIRDYMSHELQGTLHQIEDLNRQERTIRDARGRDNRQRRDEAESRAKRVRENLLTTLPPAATYEFLDVTHTANAVNFRTVWQEKNRSIDCLQELGKRWREGSRYYRDIFESPKIDLAILPPYSFLIQFTFTLVVCPSSFDGWKSGIRKGCHYISLIKTRLTKH